MIKNVIFDIGKVLLSYEPFEYVLSFGHGRELSEKLFNIVFEDKRWLELDRGTLPVEKYLEMLIKENPNYPKEIEEIFTNWIKMLEPIEKAVKFYTELKNKGYKIYLLSNFGVVYDKVEEIFDFLKLADGKIISAHVKTIKPEPKIYELLLSTYNLIPNECVFIDDKEENVLAAKEFSINTIHFINIETTIKEFENIIKE